MKVAAAAEPNLEQQPSFAVALQTIGLLSALIFLISSIYEVLVINNLYVSQHFLIALLLAGLCVWALLEIVGIRRRRAMAPLRSLQLILLGQLGVMVLRHWGDFQFRPGVPERLAVPEASPVFFQAFLFLPVYLLLFLAINRCLILAFADGERLRANQLHQQMQLLRQTEAELQASEERHRRLADHMLDVVWAIGLDGHFTYLSPSVEQLRGFSPEEVMALPLHQNFTPESFARVAEGLSKARDDVAAGRPVHFHAELEEICKDGHTVWTEAKATSLFTNDGNFLEVVGISRDITLQRQLREELRISEERYRLLAENARDVIWTMEADGRISYLSPSVQLLRGFSPEESMAQTLEQTLTPDSLQRSKAYLQQLHDDLQAGRSPQPHRGELEYYCRDGSTVWAEVIVLPTFNRQAGFDKLLGVSRDISERKHYECQLMAANQQLQQLATTDGLTGIWNRRQLEASIQKAINHADRYGESLSLILCDIDHFKDINDHFGHLAGDQVLIEFSRRIQQHLRSGDGFGRWGGEEFLILLDHTDAPAARALAETMRQLIAGRSFAQVGTVTASFGMAQRRGQEPAADWFQRLDHHLYAAKASGRNCVAGD